MVETTINTPPRPICVLVEFPKEDGTMMRTRFGNYDNIDDATKAIAEFDLGLLPRDRLKGKRRYQFWEATWKRIG
jgi:hypothetical protein